MLLPGVAVDGLLVTGQVCLANYWIKRQRASATARGNATARQTSGVKAALGAG